MARVILQRHTHPDIDLKICHGWSDIAVRAEYEQQDLLEVKAQYSQIEGIEKIRKVYSSPLQRCSRLAGDLVGLTAATEIVYDDRLKELNFGDWEQHHWDDIFKMEGSEAWFNDFLNVRVSGGESFVDLYGRVESFFEMLKELDEDVLVVTHSGVIRAAMAVVGDCALTNVFDNEVKYGGVVEVRV